MAEEIVLHTEINYKLDQAKDLYIKIYPVTTAGDVIMEKNVLNEKTLSEEPDQIVFTDTTTLTDVITILVDIINRRAKEPYYDTANKLTSLNPVLKAGQFAIESDRLGVKVGDGSSSFINLPYLINPK